MDYSNFLFSQLFMTYVEEYGVGYDDLAYDIMYEEILKHKKAFDESSFNVDTQSEYDCITDYLKNNVT